MLIFVKLGDRSYLLATFPSVAKPAELAGKFIIRTSLPGSSAISKGVQFLSSFLALF